MIKFRCLNCGQKIAVNPEGAGVTIGCPNCSDRLIVPPRTDVEFLPAPTVDLSVVEPLGRPRAEIKAALLPHLARAMMNRVLQAVLLQRQHLLDTQQTATAQVAELEQRVILLHAKLQRRLAYYQERVNTLEAELAARHEEIRELKRRPQPFLRREIEPEPVAATRVNLRNAGFLLRT